MSIDTALAALNATPAPAPTPAAVVNQQAISPKEVAAATVESEAKAKNDVKIADPVTDAKIVETAALKPAETPKAADSAKFSALAKKEKAILEQTKLNKVKEAGFAEREATIAAREAKIKESEALWDTDVFKALELRGYDYTKLTQLMLDGKSAAPAETDPIKVAKKTIEDFKKELAQKDTDKADADKKAKEAADKKQQDELNAAWESYNSEVNSYIESNKDTYELISTYAQQDLIAQTVDEFYKVNKRVLSVKEAADMVESYLESEAEKALNTKKIGGKVTRTATKETAPEPKTTKTLTNSMQPTAASVLPAATEADRMKRALAAMESKR